MKKKYVKRIGIFILLISIIFIGVIGYKEYIKSQEVIVFNKSSFDKEIKTTSSFVPAVYILNNSNEKYETIKKYFYSAGFDIIEGNVENYNSLKKDKCILLIPEKEGMSLKENETELIINNLKNGSKIIYNGNSPLNEKLDIKPSNKKSYINSYVWENHKNVKIKLQENNEFKLFKCDNKDIKVLAKYKESPLVIKGNYGNGNYIYSGMELWKANGEGYEISPYMIEAIVEEFNIKPQLLRNDLAAYININFFLNEKPENTAERTLKAGISQLNISGWTLNNKEYTKNLIKECHKRGITTYLWLEFPMVSIDFWNEHPEWREKTGKGKDAQIDWRYLMALENPECFSAVEKYLIGVLNEFDWDGVDIAEIYFEAPEKGINKPSTFTPMHDSFRNEFKEKYGVDPKDIVQSKFGFLNSKNNDMKENIKRERIELVTELNEKVLQICEKVKVEKPYLKTMVTVIDSLIDKKMEGNIGISAEKLIKLQNKYNFVLQIEDPYTLWKYGPQRYQIIGQNYKNLMEKEKKLAIDINFVDRGGRVYPTKKQRGAEVLQLLYNANLSTDQVTFYAIETMVDSDMKLVPFVRRNDIKISDMGEGKYQINSDKKFSIVLNTNKKQYLVDGKPWPFVKENEIILPKGSHLFEEKAGSDTNVYIKSISGEIISGEIIDRGIDFEYEGSNRCYISFEKIPNKILVDNKEINISSEDKQYYNCVLPEGRHKVNLIYK